MKKYQKVKKNPLDFIKQWGWDIDHIKFNPNLKESECDFYKTKGSTHDGTLIFTRENLQNLLIELANMESFSKKNPPEPGKKVMGIKYEVGFIKWAMVFGIVNIPAGRYPGLRERMRISVKCEYIYDQT